MEKPIVFFSHSSRDEKSLRELKNLIENKTGGAVSFFLSSDGQSIPFGRNWVYEIDISLSKASLMFVFVTPNSIKSNWIYFETGYSYSRGIKVIPVGLGIDLDSINPPLSLLQGFNLNKPETLANIIAIINETYDTKFDGSFSEKDYESILLVSDIQLGVLSVNVLGVRLEHEPDIETMKIISEVLTSNTIEHVISGDMIWASGLQIRRQENGKVGVLIDGLMLGIYIPIVQQLYSDANFALSDDNGEIFFEHKYYLATESFVKQTAMLAQTEIKPEMGQYLKYKDVSFKLVDLGVRGAIRMDVQYKDAIVSFEWINDVSRILLEKSVILIEDPSTVRRTGSPVVTLG